MDIGAILRSRTFWGTALVVVAMVLSGVFGFEVTEAEQSALLEWIIGITGGLGAVVALYGRWRRRNEIS